MVVCGVVLVVSCVVLFVLCVCVCVACFSSYPYCFSGGRGCLLASLYRPDSDEGFALTPLLHTSHSHRSFTPPIHTSHSHLPFTPPIHPYCFSGGRGRFLPPLYRPDSDEGVALTPLLHASHPYRSFTPPIHTSHAHLPYTRTVSQEGAAASSRLSTGLTPIKASRLHHSFTLILHPPSHRSFTPLLHTAHSTVYIQRGHEHTEQGNDPRVALGA